MTPRLSILICTIESRAPQFDRLVEVLEKQRTPEIQLGYLCDEGFKRGGMTRGAKRKQLLEWASGDFIVFKDDDDPCPEDYVESILPHCNEGVDCIGHLFDCIGYATPRTKVERACVSIRYPQWKDNVDGFRYVRHTHHLVPVRREHALKAGFDPRLDTGEDFKYSMRLKSLGLLKTEAFIDKVLYTIHHNPTKKPGT